MQRIVAPGSVNIERASIKKWLLIYLNFPGPITFVETNRHVLDLQFAIGTVIKHVTKLDSGYSQRASPLL